MEFYKRLGEATQALMEQSKPKQISEKGTQNAKNQTIPKIVPPREEPKQESQKRPNKETKNETKTILLQIY